MISIEELYNMYFHHVFLYIKAISGDESIAEEITQETFFKALRSYGSFREECDVCVWLCRIAKNCYYTALKKKSHFSDNDIPKDLPSTDGNITEMLTDREDAERIHKILHTLDEPYKEVFTLRTMGELSFAQISSLFGKTESWARVTYHRAKTKIIDKMEADNK